MPLLDLRFLFPALVMSGLASAVAAAELPVEVGRLQGEVVVIQDQQPDSPARGGEVPVAGTRIHTGADGRAELMVNGVPSLFVGPDSQLLLHSADGDILRARLLQGTMRIDTRASSGKPRRDLRLNAGDMQLRIAGGEVWVEQSPDQSQVCSSAGVAELQLKGRRDRLDFPGQCVRNTGVETAWTLVPPEILSGRMEMLNLAPILASSPQPAAPQPIPLPPPEPEPTATGVVEAVEPMIAAAAVEGSTDVATDAGGMTSETLSAAEPLVAAEDVAPVEGHEELITTTPNTTTVEATEADDGMVDLQEALAHAEAMADSRAEDAVLAMNPGSEAAAVIRPAAAAETDADAGVEAADPSAPEVAEVAAVSVESAVLIPAGPASAVAAAAEEAAVAEEALAAADGDVDEADDGRRWSVVLASMSTPEAADNEVDRLRGMGLQPEAREYQVDDRHGYRVGLGRFMSREEADAALLDLRTNLPSLPAWVARY